MYSYTAKVGRIPSFSTFHTEELKIKLDCKIFASLLIDLLTSLSPSPKSMPSQAQSQRVNLQKEVYKKLQTGFNTTWSFRLKLIRAKYWACIIQKVMAEASLTKQYSTFKYDNVTAFIICNCQALALNP